MVGRPGGQQDRQAPLMLSLFFKLDMDIHCPKISDEFDYGGSASLNMCRKDHLMSQPVMAFLGSFFQAKATKFGRNGGLNMSSNICYGSYHSHKKCFGELFSHFLTSHIENYY